jgi:hypothetical protein
MHFIGEKLISTAETTTSNFPGRQWRWPSSAVKQALTQARCVISEIHRKLKRRIYLENRFFRNTGTGVKAKNGEVIRVGRPITVSHVSWYPLAQRGVDVCYNEAGRQCQGNG